MLRYTTSVALICFLVWIIPLGAFISIDKERLACGGQRAICLCSTSLAGHPSGGEGKIAMIKSPGLDKESGSSGSPGHEFLSAILSFDIKKNGSNRFELASFYSYPLVCRSIESVPKA